MKCALLFFVAAILVQAAPSHFTGPYGTAATIDNPVLSGDQLTFTLFNTTLSGTITGLGFDLPGSFPDTFVLNSSSLGSFTLVHDADTIAGAVTSDPIFDLALITGADFGAGIVANGIGEGQNSTIMITGPFGGLTADQIVQSISLRFEGIIPKNSATVAEPTVDTAVPEPATSALLGVGLLAIGLIARRKRG